MAIMKRTAKQAPHPLDIPPCLSISKEDRNAAWVAKPPRAFVLLEQKRDADKPVDTDKVAAEALRETLKDQKKRAALAKLKTLPKKAKPAKDGLGRDMQERLPDLAAVVAFGKANGMWDDKYAQLNPGQQRMLVGNKMRARLKKDPKLVIKW